MRTLVAIMTVRNRADTTIRCLRGLTANRCTDCRVDVIIVDDFSDDDTIARVRQEFPHVEVIVGGGDLYWAKGMALAEQAAMKMSPDFLIWLNDDAELAPHALGDLLDCFDRSESPDCIVSGTLVSAEDRSLVTYGGLVRASKWRLKLRRVPAAQRSQEVDTFNGNLVLVPSHVCTAIGGIDADFAHHYADWDFGFRAARAGVKIVTAGGVQGTTERNSISGSFRDRSISPKKRWNLLLGPKGLPPRDQARFLKRHAGGVWSFQLAWTYARYFTDIWGLGWIHWGKK